MSSVATISSIRSNGAGSSATQALSTATYAATKSVFF